MYPNRASGGRDVGSRRRSWLWVALAVALVLLLAEAVVAVLWLTRGSGSAASSAQSPRGARYTYTAPAGWDTEYQHCQSSAPPWNPDRQPVPERYWPTMPDTDLTCLHESGQHSHPHLKGPIAVLKRLLVIRRRSLKVTNATP